MLYSEIIFSFKLKKTVTKIIIVIVLIFLGGNMANKQYYGIKYPFTCDGFQNFYADVNSSLKDKVRSQVMHVIFTPKGQRLRKPEFGTDLIKHIFEPNDSVSWEAVKNEVMESVKRWVDNVSVNDIQVVKSEDDKGEIFVRVDYSVSEGNKVVSDTVIASI